MRTEFLSRGTLQTLLDAESSEWMQARAEAVHMLSTPWAMQPTEAIRAVWEGSRQERAGLKSFSGEWLELDLDPVRS